MTGREDKQMNATTIINARVFDGHVLQSWTSVRLVDGVIGECAPHSLAEPDDEVVDAAGGVVLPGLIDAHTHLLPGAPGQALTFGVTTELDMFSKPELVARVKSEAARRDDVADVRSAGIGATAPGGHPSMMYAPFPTLTGPGEAAGFVAARIAEGSDYLKVIYESGTPESWSMPSLDLATVRALVTAAHDRELVVIAHATSVAAVADVVDAGVDVIAHVPVDRVLDDAVISRIAAAGVAVCPTLATIENACGEPGGPTLARDPAVAEFLGPDWTATLLASASGWRAADMPPYSTARQNVARLAAAGVELLAGTDAPNPGTVHGASLHRELELLVDAGLSPAQALTTATAAPAARFLAGDDAEEDFDHIHPRSRGWGEVHGDPRILGEPVLDLGVFVGGVVVGDHVQAHLGVGLGYQLEEVQELGVGVALVAGVGHCAGRDLQCREQARGAVAEVVVGGLLGQPSPHRQDRSGAVERLDLGFLVDADHDRLLRAGSDTSRRRRGPWRPAQGRWRT